MNRRLLLKLVAAVVPALAAGSAGAQNFPNKPVTIIAPFSPGGALDLIARSLGQELGKEWGQSVIVDNKAGAAGIIGSHFVARAAPDGYTILLGATTTHGINPTLYSKLPYDAIKDFTPISLVATIPHVLVVNPGLPINTVSDFVKHAKANKGLSFGSAGIGSPHHLAGELLKTKAGIDLLHVPYKGAGPAMLAVMSGEANFMSIETAAALQHIKAGKLKPIAVAAARRAPEIDVPTFAEAGMNGFEVTSWYAIYGPAGLPKDVLEKLNSSIVKALQSKDVKDRLSSLGASPMGNTPAEMAAYTRNEISRWAEAVKSSGAKAD